MVAQIIVRSFTFFVSPLFRQDENERRDQKGLISTAPSRLSFWLFTAFFLYIRKKYCDGQNWSLSSDMFYIFYISVVKLATESAVFAVMNFFYVFGLCRRVSKNDLERK